MGNTLDRLAGRVKIVQRFGADIPAIDMDAHNRLVSLVQKIMNFFIRRQDVSDITRPEIERGGFAQFRIPRLRPGVETFIPNSMELVPIYAFDDPVPGMIVHPRSIRPEARLQP